MITNDATQAIANLDLGPVKIKLMHVSGESWSQAKCDLVETEYRRFLYLMKVFPDAAIAPGVSVDVFWHYHILDTMKYAADCEAAFGYFVHHFPHLGVRGDADDVAAHEAAGKRMHALYDQVFATARQSGADAAATPALLAEAAAYCYEPDAAARAPKAEPSAYSYAPGAAARALMAEPSAYSYAPGATARESKAGPVATA